MPIYKPIEKDLLTKKVRNYNQDSDQHTKKLVSTCVTKFMRSHAPGRIETWLDTK